jgi:ribosomal protein S18 acetylase RimI-like enzyme
MTAEASTIPGMRLRRAREDDQAAIATLLRALGYTAGGGKPLPALLRDALARPDFAIFLAFERTTPEGAALGLLQLSQRPQLHLGGTLVSIDALAVLPSVRGRGVGKRLLRRARAYARLHRAVRIEVHTTRARENYQRGFYPLNGYREADSALFRHEIRPAAVNYRPIAPTTDR